MLGPRAAANHQFSCVCLHSDRKPPERRENLQKFKVWEDPSFCVSSLPLQLFLECLKYDIIMLGIVSIHFNMWSVLVDKSLIFNV